MVGGLILALAVAAHPLHSSVTTIAWHAETHTIELAMRVFTQDLNNALARRPGSACGYAQAVMLLNDTAGKPIPTGQCSVTTEQDVTWIRLSATVGDPRGLRLVNMVLFEMFADQINIVQASIGGRSHTMLFTRGDGPKPLT